MTTFNRYNQAPSHFSGTTYIRVGSLKEDKQKQYTELFQTTMKNYPIAQQLTLENDDYIAFRSEKSSSISDRGIQVVDETIKDEVSKTFIKAVDDNKHSAQSWANNNTLYDPNNQDPTQFLDDYLSIEAVENERAHLSTEQGDDWYPGSGRPIPEELILDKYREFLDPERQKFKIDYLRVLAK